MRTNPSVRKPKKPTRIEKGILLAVVWLYQDANQPAMAANLARNFGVHDRDVSDHAEFDLEVYAKLNASESTRFVLVESCVKKGGLK